MFRLVLLVAMLFGSLSALLVLAPTEAGAGGGGHGSCFPTPRDGTDEPVTIEGNCFEPAVLYVEPGATVEWQQRDVIPHNVTMFGGQLVGGDGEMAKGDTVTREFNEPGVYAYYCSIHPSMIGVVVAGDPASTAFGAGLELQTTAEELRVIADYKQTWLEEFQQSMNQPGGSNESPPAWSKSSGPLPGAGWAEASVGLALAGGLAVGIVIAGGGMRFLRRGR